jgi:hypothetical protein
MLNRDLVREHRRAGPPTSLSIGSHEPVQQQSVHPDGPHRRVVLAHAVTNMQRLLRYHYHAPRRLQRHLVDPPVGFLDADDVRPRTP